MRLEDVFALEPDNKRQVFCQMNADIARWWTADLRHMEMRADITGQSEFRAPAHVKVHCATIQ